MYCPRCGKPTPDSATFCTGCGAALLVGAAAAGPAQSPLGPLPVDRVSEKRILPALLLCLFLGVLGVHRFYAGKIGTGILIILTFGGFMGIWPIIDFILIVTGNFSDGDGEKITLWT